MRSRRLSPRFRRNSSRYHRKIGALLRQSKLCSGYRIYQEYPVSRVQKEYSLTGILSTSGGTVRGRYDWIILDLHVVIEVHGEQHWESVAFGGRSPSEAERALEDQKRKDQLKKEAALEAGWGYLMIPYWDVEKMDCRELEKRVMETAAQVQVGGIVTPSCQAELGQRVRDLKEERNRRAREWRREQYQKLKQRRKSSLWHSKAS